MGPALEVFLTAVGLVLLALVGCALLTKPFWPRLVGYFRRWYERDKWLEQQQREEAECRRKAQQEMREYCHDDILRPEAGSQDGAAGSARNAKNLPVDNSQSGADNSKQAAGNLVEDEPVQQIGAERRRQ